MVDALSEYRSLVRAAEQLHVTQPALSRSLQEVEDILGVALFERTPRGVVPTAFGEVFLVHAQNVLAELDRAGSQIAELADGRSGTVTVGTHLFGSNILLPQAIASFKQEAPHATVAVQHATPEELFADVRAGRVDLLVGRLQPLVESGRETATPLYQEPICLTARRDHPLSSGMGTMESLIEWPWVVPVRGTWLRQEFEELLARRGLGLPVNRIECTSYLTVHQLIVSTEVIGLLPALVATEDPRMQTVARLSGLSQTVGVTTVDGRVLPPAAQAFLAHLDTAGTRARHIIAELELPGLLEGG